MTEHDIIIAEWLEDIVPLAPMPQIVYETVKPAMQKPYHLPFMGGKGKRDLNVRPPMQYVVTDKKRKGYDAEIFNHLDTVLDIAGHDLDNPMQNSKPSYNFGGHKHDKRVKCSFAKIDKFYASLENE